jgi:outer membrane receptor for ferrienterochelin and colicin
VRVFHRKNRSWTRALALLLTCTLGIGPALAEEEKEGDDDEIEILKITEEGITFKDEDGKTVEIADFEELSLDQLLEEEVVTTGSKRKQKASASIASVSVVTKKDLESLPYMYLGDFLGTVPGVDARWGQMQRYYIGIRGLGGTALNARTLLLWDGMPMNDPFTGSLVAGHFLPLVDVERVEVIRGPGSTLYGANAFSGVVNVITRSGKEPFKGAKASVTYGSFNTARAQAKYGRDVGPVTVGGSIEAFNTDGTFPVTDRFVDNQLLKHKNDDARSVSATARAEYKGLRMTGSYTYGERGRPGTMTTDSNGNILPCTSCHNAGSPKGQGVKYPATKDSCGSCHMQPNDREELHRGSVSLAYQKAFGDFGVGANAYHHEWHTNYRVFLDQGFIRAPVEDKPALKRRLSGAEVHGTHAYEDFNSAVVGLEFKRYEVASNLMIAPDGTSADAVELAVFLEDEFKPLSWLAVTGGVRFDYSSLFDSVLSPRGGLVVTPIERLHIRGSVSRAFRNPALSELYVVDRRGKYTVGGNLNLNPEFITALEGGASYTLLDPLFIRLGATVFYNMASDLISFKATGLDTASFFNVAEANVLGTEIEAEVAVTGDPEIRLFGNFSYQEAKDDAGLELSYAPRFKVNAGMRGKMGRFGALLRVHWVDERTDNNRIILPGFATLDAAFRVDLWRGMHMQLWATNLADSGYQHSLGVPGSRRSFYMTLGYSP